MAKTRWLIVIGLGLLASACNGGPDPSDCVQVDLACAPLYLPTDFDELHTRTLSQKCGLPGASCHATAGNQGAVSVEDIDVGYTDLRARVKPPPEDIGCSLVLQRLYASSPVDAMPPGAPLDEAERCVFVQWINAGAER